MAKIVVTAAILVALAILIILNVNYTSSVNLFGARFQNISVVVIAIAGFVLGLIYAVVLYVVTHLNRRRKTSEKARRQGLAEREAQLAAREQTAGQGAATGEEESRRGGAEAVPAKAGSRRRRGRSTEEARATAVDEGAVAGSSASATSGPRSEERGSGILRLFRGRRGR